MDDPSQSTLGNGPDSATITPASDSPPRTPTSPPPTPAPDSAPTAGSAPTPAPDKAPTAGSAPTPDSVSPTPDLPDYKGAPLDADRGPGLGCFWFQVGMLVLLLVLTPISVWIHAPSWLSAALLIIVLVLLFFTGQTMIFLLRLVAADRRSQRRPLAPTARKTVGQLEQDASAPTVSHEDDATSDEPLT